ncbi:MAG: hypothetical protein COA82_02055 [Alkaliphilus sp.]|nr:glutathionylspermidine synthase family protein [bacterium AH-315-E09]PHS36084.1 MAG: hypothetical protein COA82_02055 [Alkaliphilus sp.]
METQKIFEMFKERALEDKKKYTEEYYNIVKEVEKSPAKYKGEPVEFLYQPMFIGEEEIRKFEILAKQLMGILKKVINRYLVNEEFRKYFNFSPLLERLILKDFGYHVQVPMARFDIFYHYKKEGFQFCELNADGSSGMLEQRELARIIGKSSLIKSFKEDLRLESFELFNSWANVILENYRLFSGGNEKPQVAIVDWLDGEPPSEFIEFQRVFENAGMKTVIVDPRQLKYKGSKLYHNEFRIDCVYRRAVTVDIIERADEAKELIDAYLEGNVCVVGPFRSQIIHNKIIFSILHDCDATAFLSAEDREFIERHIPHTVVLDGENDKLIDSAIANKNFFVLKPMDKYASKDVCIGKDYSDAEWAKRVKEAAGNNYLIQELCSIPTQPMAIVSSKEVEFKEMNYIIGLFLYNEELQGVYTRVGSQNLIGSVVECYTVPCYLVKERNTSKKSVSV